MDVKHHVYLRVTSPSFSDGPLQSLQTSPDSFVKVEGTKVQAVGLSPRIFQIDPFRQLTLVIALWNYKEPRSKQLATAHETFRPLLAVDTSHSLVKLQGTKARVFGLNPRVFQTDPFRHWGLVRTAL